MQVDYTEEILLKIGVPEPVVFKIIEYPEDSSKLDLSQLIDLARLFPKEENPFKFRPEILYKTILYTTDFTRLDIIELIEKELTKYDYDMIREFPPVILTTLLKIENGLLALKLYRFVEKDYSRAENLIKAIIKKSYPRINKYVKENKTISEEFFEILEKSYSIELKMPEYRCMFYLMACLLNGDYMRASDTDGPKLYLSKLDYTLIITKIEDVPRRDVDNGEVEYIRNDDMLGYFNADYPSNRKCDYSRKYGDSAKYLPNTNAGELRKDLINEFKLTKEKLDDPYNMVYIRFKEDEGKSIVSLDGETEYFLKFLRDYPLTTAHKDMLETISMATTSFIKPKLTQSVFDLILDLVMRHMSRHGLGVKRDSKKVLDYICHAAYMIKDIHNERSIIIKNSIEFSKEENSYINKIDVLEEKLEFNQSLLKATEGELARCRNTSELEREIERLKTELLAKDNKINKLENQIENEKRDREQLARDIDSQKEKDPVKCDIEFKDKVIDILSKDIIYVGGNPNTVSKLKAEIPELEVITFDECNRRKETMSNKEIVVLDISYTSHSSWWKFKRNYPELNVLYIQNYSNVEIWVDNVYRLMLQRNLI